MLTMAGLTLARGILGAFTDQYPSFRTPHPVNLAFALGACVTVVLNTIALLVAWRDEAEFKLRELAVTDPLTGLPNRRGFEERAQAMLAHARRHGLPLTALMLDLDHFKQINDAHGHEVGDRALQLFSQLLKETRRDGDLAARLGGEEFCLLLHDGPAAGLPLDQRLRARLQQEAPARLGLALDFSAGLAALRPGDTGIQPLLARADAALYQAKTAGRGRLCSAAPMES
jgi:diguanylate cyclase (GGDEF)-like protein